MSQSKLFDYSSSFAVTRTNPKLTGNYKITLDSQGEVWFNSFDANPTLSDSRFKKFNITGENSIAKDLFNFFDQGQTSKDLVFQVRTTTQGQFQASENFSGQYDFFYASGASVLADKNYTEDFRYFAPLWVKNEIPDFFVIFKVPGPLNYPYSQNVSSINPGAVYKLVQDFDSDEEFTIIYGKNPAGLDVFFTAGQTFVGNSNYSSYTVVKGSGKVAIFDELAYLTQSDDVNFTFINKILPNCSAVKTFDLRENTKIGKYIRKIFNNPNFSNSPIDINWGSDSYSYFKGVSYSDGVFTSKGELLTEYLASSSSDLMIDLEDYITSGFSRNGIICPNLLNLEFLFSDDDSDDYTINRYFGFYVSRNDFATFELNGNFFFQYKDLEGNQNYPKPLINNIGYYYNNYSTPQSATSGVRIFYENATGFMPGSDNVNLYDPNKIFYITDKFDNFYTLKRSETYVQPGGSGPEFSYGHFDFTSNQFTATGSTGATCGSLVVGNVFLDLFNFTGNDEPTQRVGTTPARNAVQPGRAYLDITFLKNYDLPNPLTFKIFWPNGSQREGAERFDIIKSADFSSILRWVGGSYYSTGDSYYFNAGTGTTADIARGFSDVIKEINDVVWNSGSNGNHSVIRVSSPGNFGNDNFSLSVFDNYSFFESNYKGIWNSSESYSTGDIIMFENNYFQSSTYIPAPSPFQSNPQPGGTSWTPYKTFTGSGYLEIFGTDAFELTRNVPFTGGTLLFNNRIFFPKEDSNLVKTGSFIPTTKGFSEIVEITRYVDEPIRDPDTEKIISFKDFETFLVANLKDPYAIVKLGTDKSLSVFSTTDLNLGVFTFFDTKEFDFDFWSSNYSYNPNPETFRYYQILADTEGVISINVPYFVKFGQIGYAGSVYNQGDIFYGATGFSSFQNINPSPDSYPVVFPAQFSDVTYDSSLTSYGGNIGYYKDFESFLGFIGIQDLKPGILKQNSSKEQVFQFGKLQTEYDYLKENYTRSRANISRIVPYINKWGYSNGVDARGNSYRLNSSPAFTPLNFSPSLDRTVSDPRYLNQEWFLLEQPPIDFPLIFMNSQNSYLSGKIDLSLLKDANPSNSLYASSYFTVDPKDYPQEFRDIKSYTKELFTPLNYNKASGYYETLFRGVKVVIKKRSLLKNKETTSLDRYVPFSRVYEGYKFSAILRAIPEDSTKIQSPVTYDVIENTQQKFIVFVCDLVVKDQRVFELGYTGGTGGNPIIDYTCLYSMSDKTRLISPLVSGSNFTGIDDIKLSCGLDLSLQSGSSVTTSAPGRINISVNPNYDTDLREEINTFFVENTVGATSGLSSTGIGSFSVPSISSAYPWPIGVGPRFVEFGRISPSTNYTFSIPFATTSPVEIPIGPASIYRTSPVFQISGGSKYFSQLLYRVSVSYISDQVNLRSPYIKYKTYYWDSNTNQTLEKNDDFEIYLESPTKIVKSLGTDYSESFSGPQELKGNSVANSYNIISNQVGLPSTLQRYSGGYEPLFRKVIFFDNDKIDTVTGSTIDLSFRNCNFAPYKYYFGISRNLSYTKVSLGNPILALSNSFPEGPVYPLINQTPIARKDFNLFSSSWDPGYYERYLSAKDFQRVAGTRSMVEYNTFFGSKIMQTPNPVLSENYITLQISRVTGNTNVEGINEQIFSFIGPIQSITSSNSGTGIGRVGPYLSPVDFDKLDPNIFPNAEVIWQYFSESSNVAGFIRLDRILRRQLLNSGAKKEFINNMISDFGVGNPDLIDDDVSTYIDQNVTIIYEGNEFKLYLKKTGSESLNPDLLVRGDISSSELSNLGYVLNPNFQLTKFSNLIYGFSFPLEKNYSYCLQFQFSITKL